MTAKSARQCNSGSARAQDKAEWPEGDIRAALQNCRASDLNLPVDVEVWVRPSEPESGYCLLGTLGRFRKTRNDWEYHVAIGDPTTSQIVKCRGNRIHRLLKQNERRNDLHEAWNQCAIDRADSSSASPGSKIRREKKAQKQRDEIVSGLEGEPHRELLTGAYRGPLTEKDRELLTRFRVDPEKVNGRGTDPVLCLKILQACFIAYLEGHELVRHAHDVTKPTKSVFERVGEEFSKSSSQIEKHFYRWLSAANLK